jgi:hypothetical protein
MRTLAGPTASIAFTNLSSATSASLSTAFSNTNISDSDSASSPAQAQAKCYKQGVLALMKARDIDIPLERVCLLDPKASLALTPSDGDAGKFTWFLFGVRPVPSLSLHPHSLLFLSFFLRSFIALSPSVSFSVLGFILVGRMELGYPRYVYMRSRREHWGRRV